MNPNDKPAPLLEVSNLQTHITTREGIARAVDDVSFHINAGETLGLVGESGCGKSMTSLSLLRLVPEPPAKIVGGRILLEGRDLLELSRDDMRRVRGNDISMIFQEPMTSLNPIFTVGAQICEVLALHRKMSPKEARAQAIELLRTVGIALPERRVDDYPHQLSGGMRQRAMIAMALACRPKVLIADEPTTALDVTVQAQILDLIARLQQEIGMAVLLITHDLGVIVESARRVCIMYAGRIVEAGPVREIFSNPVHPYTKGLLRAIPRSGRAAKERLIEIPGTVPQLTRLPGGCRFCPRYDACASVCREETPPQVFVGPDHWVTCWAAADAA